MKYSDEFIRGIPNDTYMCGEYPNAQLFKEFRGNSLRNDNYEEISINWYDDEGALQLLLEQKKSGDSNDYQFKSGAAIVPCKSLDKIRRKPQIKGLLDYERREINGNKYHGNILLKEGTPKPLRDMIASALALSVERVELRQKADSVKYADSTGI